MENLTVGPMVRLVINIAGVDYALQGGDVFDINFAISHDPMNANSVQILEMLLGYPAEYLIAPQNFTILYGNGEAQVFGKRTVWFHYEFTVDS